MQTALKPTEVKPRNIIVDNLKNIAIAGVVFIHVCGGFIDGNTVKPSWGERDFLVGVLRYALRFAVPMFIIFWAYYYELGLRRQPGSNEYRNRRFLQLFRVFLFWSLLYVLAWTPLKAVPRMLFSLQPWTGNGWPGQYYLVTLFQLIIVFPLLQWLARSNTRVIVTLVVSFLMYLFMFLYVEQLPKPVLVFAYRPFFYWIAYAVIGIWLTRQPRTTVSRAWLLLLLVLPVEYLLTDPPPLHLMRYIRPGVFIASLALAPFLLEPPRLFSKPGWFTELRSFSANNTLTVFVLHPLMILALPINRMNQVMAGYRQWTFLLANLAIAMVIFLLCLLVAWLINRSPLKGWIN